MMKNEKIIFAACSEVKTESSGTWFQTFPAYGRYAVGGIIKGADPKAEFIFDEAAAKEIITNFREAMAKADWPGVLVDREHFSADREKTSDAMAWAKDIRQEADGSIWTKWEFTAPGRELWEGKVLISRSPLFACTREGINFRPFRLESIGMTNTPHFKELSTLAAAKAAPTKGNSMKYDLPHLIARCRAKTVIAAASDECRAADPSKCRVHGSPDNAKDWHNGASDTNGKPSRVSAMKNIRDHLTKNEKLSQFSPEFRKRMDEEIGKWDSHHSGKTSFTPEQHKAHENWINELSDKYYEADMAGRSGDAKKLKSMYDKVEDVMKKRGFKKQFDASTMRIKFVPIK